MSYRAAATFEPVKGLMFYGMYATAYDPAAAGIFSVSPANSLELTSARIYETGVKVISDDKRAEVDRRRLRHRAAQRLCVDHQRGRDARRRGPHQGRRVRRRRASGRQL